jgi:hypothetical protein
MSDFPAVIDVNELDGEDGFALIPRSNNSETGLGVSSAGDLNGDGYADFLVGANLAGTPDAGRSGQVYVVYGHGGGYAPSFALAGLNGSNGYTLDGNQFHTEFGQFVTGLGDINGDGYDDFATSAWRADASSTLKGAGEVFVVFGGPGGAAEKSVSDLDGSNGFTIPGSESHGEMGQVIHSAGDLNGDGHPDFIIGDFDQNKAYVIYGRDGDFGATFDPATLDGSNGFTIQGDGTGFNGGSQILGISAASLGDVNGDGIDDLLIGDDAHYYFLPGSRAGIPATVLLPGYPSASSSSEGSDYGYGAFQGGDVNGDGYADVIVTVPDADFNVPQARVEFGGPSFSLTVPPPSSGPGGFTIMDSTGDPLLGFAASGIGDVNGDGLNDIAVQVYTHPSGEQEQVSNYIVFGRADGVASIDVTKLDGSDGFEIAGTSVGAQISSAGDINGDGLDDILVGDYQAQGSLTGGGSVIFGQLPQESVLRQGTVASQNLVGGNFNDRLEGLDGNDNLYGNGGHDILVGGNGNDTLYGGTGDDTLWGNAGNDTASYAYATGGVHVDLTTTGAQIIGADQGSDKLIGIENVTGSAFADALIGNGSVNTLTGGTGNDTLTGGKGQDTLIGGDGNDTLVYNAAIESTGQKYDIVTGFDAAQDIFAMPFAVTGVDATVTGGKLDADHINGGLGRAVNAAALGVHHAVLFTPDSGTLAGHTFLVVDANGVAGYQSNQDFAIELTQANLAGFGVGNFSQ